jgi:hypothetical protein
MLFLSQDEFPLYPSVLGAGHSSVHVDLLPGLLQVLVSREFHDQTVQVMIQSHILLIDQIPIIGVCQPSQLFNYVTYLLELRFGHAFSGQRNGVDLQNPSNVKGFGYLGWGTVSLSPSSSAADLGQTYEQ